MASFVFANFYQTTLSLSAGSGATQINVASATGAPTLATGQQWPLVLQSAATPSVREVVYVTAISGTLFTVTRAQEGTTAQSWSAADLVSGDPTAGSTAAMGNFLSGGIGALSSNTTLAAKDANINWQVSAGTQTLPTSTGVSGASYAFSATAACTVAVGGGDSFQGGSLSGSTSVALAAGDWLVVQSNGAGGYVVVSAGPDFASYGPLINIQVISVTGTYTPSAGAVRARVVGIGGGGGGGGVGVSTGVAGAAAGGGSGGYGELWISSGLTSTSVTIGAGGVGAVGGATGSNGGTTSFGALASWPGGQGGGAGAGATSPSVSSSAGAGGAAPTGVKYGTRGNAGQAGIVLSALSALCGGGADSPLGAGGPASGAIASVGDAGKNAGGYGAGGGGALGVNYASAVNGGNGSAGVVIVYEYS